MMALIDNSAASAEVHSRHPQNPQRRLDQQFLAGATKTTG
jgi:hypothetical protein